MSARPFSGWTVRNQASSGWRISRRCDRHFPLAPHPTRHRDSSMSEEAFWRDGWLDEWSAVVVRLASLHSSDPCNPAGADLQVLSGALTIHTISSSMVHSSTHNGRSFPPQALGMQLLHRTENLIMPLALKSPLESKWLSVRLAWIHFCGTIKSIQAMLSLVRFNNYDQSMVMRLSVDHGLILFPDVFCEFARCSANWNHPCHLGPLRHVLKLPNSRQKNTKT
jgi:hypothetical protein